MNAIFIIYNERILTNKQNNPTLRRSPGYTQDQRKDPKGDRLQIPDQEWSGFCQIKKGGYGRGSHRCRQ